ncbi:exo-beta-N-acetylmuramidase NamZ family protein [Anaerohalosphaeraceae bacterium U12dextr]
MMFTIIGVLVALCLAAQPIEPQSVRTGLDQIGAHHSLFENKRVGIVANHTARNSKGQFIVDVFREMEGVSVTALFGPEHGFEGVAQDGVKVTDASFNGIPIYSLYGKTYKPTPEMLANVDVLVFDIQDIGARYYTYIYTMAYSMEAAAECGKPFVVLDRPNPINSLSVQGNILHQDFASFVGLYPIPVRHGMTIGELARLFNGQKWLKNGIQADLTVIEMANYQRCLWYDQTGLAFIRPSPNMTNLDAAAVYPGLCLLEGTNLSEGRGTDRPFLQCGAPWIDAEAFAEELNKANLPGLQFAPVRFTPTASKYANQDCAGVLITITDRQILDPFWSGVHLVQTACRMYPGEFEWNQLHFDHLCGTDQIRIAIAGQKSLDDIKVQAQTQLEAFLPIRQKYLLYPDM